MEKEFSIGEIVALDYRTASVFKEAGIDFCCGGKKSLEEACSEKGIDSRELKKKIETARSVNDQAIHNYNEWDPGFLCDYIVNRHHKYVHNSMKELSFYTGKIAQVHGERHPELKEIAELFTGISHELTGHLRNEEEVLFPMIKSLSLQGNESPADKIVSVIKDLSAEHESAGGAVDRISVLSSGYTVPSDGCNTYHLTYKLLKEFEDDLHTHVHLENNVLFSKILKSLK
jgi:regulator of cell morphogenesis and NO signaling